MAVTPSSLSAEAQVELLLGVGLPFETWKADTPLGDFEGVEVGEDGLVAVLNFSNFSQKEDIKFKLHSFRPLVSLKEINFSGCRNAIGEVLVKMATGGPRAQENWNLELA